MEYVRSTIRPKVYVIGRDQAQGSALVDRLRTLNSDAVAVFIPTDLTLLCNVDEVCHRIMEEESQVNLLFLTANYLSLQGRDGKSRFYETLLRTHTTV